MCLTEAEKWESYVDNGLAKWANQRTSEQTEMDTLSVEETSK